MTRLLMIALALTLAGGCLAQEDPLAWVDAQQVRAAYHYANAPAPERCARLKAAGINALVLKAGVEKARPWCREAKLQGMRCFLALNFNVDAEKAGLRQAVLENGAVERYACPLDERFWREHLTPAMMERAAVADDPEMQVDGLWIDFELYSTRTGQRCPRGRVRRPQTVAGRPRLRGRVSAIPRRAGRGAGHRSARNRSCEIPEFPAGLLPHSAQLVTAGGGARFLHRAGADTSLGHRQILLWATDTYGGGGADRVPDDWRALYADQGINARYLAGLLLRCYSAKNLAANIYHATAKCDGYWLFTTYTLEAEEQKGDYHLAEGTPDDYWDALRVANDEMDRRIEQGEAYRSELVVGPEPVVYKPLTQPEFRERLARLILPEPLAEPVDLPFVKLRGANVLVLAGRAGQEARVSLAYHQVGAVEAELSWKIMDADRAMIAEGVGEKQEGVTLSFTPEADGIYYVLAGAGSSAWSVQRTNVPVGLYVGGVIGLVGAAHERTGRVVCWREAAHHERRGAALLRGPGGCRAVHAAACRLQRARDGAGGRL